jgi:multimeric flavodoxin WrbA
MISQLKILGVNGSPRKANTEILLNTALSVAAEEGFEVETVNLRGNDIRFCQGCFKCHIEAENELGCRIHRDSMDDILPKLKDCHGLIIASPVYFGQVSAQMKVFMDRTEPLLRYANGPWRSALKNKVGGGLVVGGNRNGGQEATLQAIHHFFLIHDMVVVGTSSDERPGCYLGAATTTHPKRGREKKAVLEDEQGLAAVRYLAKRICEVTRQIFD